MTRAKKQVAAIAAVAFLLFAAIANAQDRTALIIANANYGDGHESEAVKADASQLAESLRSAGFVVAVRENLGAKQFAPAVREFAKQTRTGGVAVIYYMGLAGQYQTYNSKGAWWNYLQGVEVTSGRMDSFALADLLKSLDDHSTADSHFVFLDGCGKNPFHGENQRAGLAEVAADDLASTNTLVCLAAQPGKTVEAGRSKLAAALAAQLKQADQPVEQLLAAVKRDVERQSGGEQSPWFVAADEQVAKTAWRDGRRFVASDAPTDGLQAGDEWTNGLGMVFCWCPPGKFTMGVAGQASRLSAADITQDERQTERLFHDAAPTEVTLSRGFWIGKFEMTQREYFRLRNRGPDRESLLLHRNAPLSHLKFGDAENICRLLNEMESKAGRLPDDWQYVLPSEAQWEYACRAGSTSRYGFGDATAELPRYANFADRSLLNADDSFYYALSAADDGVAARPAVVGSYLPNAWGLYDMHGNVREWCSDVYGPQLPGGVDPISAVKATEHTTRVTRGGAWCSMAEYCQSGFRNALSHHPNATKFPFMGVRVVLTRQPKSE